MTKHMKQICLAGFMIATIALMGCSGNGGSGETTTGGNAGTGDSVNNEIVLTELEERLLLQAYGDAERIESGNLLEHQVFGLEQLRTAIEYLSDKYGDRQPEIVSFDPANKFNGKAALLLSDGSDRYYELTVTPAGGEYVCADNYYGAIVRESYDQYLAEILSQTGYDCICHTNFSALLGKEADGSITVDTVKALDPPPMRSTDIFVFNETEQNKAAEELQQKLNAEKMYGAYTVCFVSEQDGRDVDDLIEHRGSFQRTSFNCFTF